MRRRSRRPDIRLIAYSERDDFREQQWRANRLARFHPAIITNDAPAARVHIVSPRPLPYELMREVKALLARAVGRVEIAFTGTDKSIELIAPEGKSAITDHFARKAVRALRKQFGESNGRA